jgi:hypothetical protein
MPNLPFVYVYGRENLSVHKQKKMENKKKKEYSHKIPSTTTNDDCILHYYYLWIEYVERSCVFLDFMISFVILSYDFM